jgi:acetolactate synthase I/III small subunit
MEEQRNYIITMLVANKPAVTSRVTGLFSGRGYNMESICGAPTHNPEISRITIKTKATPSQYTEIQKQLNRMIDIIKVRDMTEEEKAVQREMALISVIKTPENSDRIVQLAEQSGAKIINIAEDSCILEISGLEQKINTAIDTFRPLGIKKVTRSGILALYKELEEDHKQ